VFIICPAYSVVNRFQSFFSKLDGLALSSIFIQSLNVFIASVPLISLLFLCSIHVTVIFCICWTIFFSSCLSGKFYNFCFIVTFTAAVLANLAELIVLTGQKLSVRACVCLSVNQGGTNQPLHVKTCHLACTDLLMNSDHETKTRSV